VVDVALQAPGALSTTLSALADIARMVQQNLNSGSPASGTASAARATDSVMQQHVHHQQSAHAAAAAPPSGPMISVTALDAHEVTLTRAKAALHNVSAVLEGGQYNPPSAVAPAHTSAVVRADDEAAASLQRQVQQLHAAIESMQREMQSQARSHAAAQEEATAKIAALKREAQSAADAAAAAAQALASERAAHARTSATLTQQHALHATMYRDAMAAQQAVAALRMTSAAAAGIARQVASAKADVHRLRTGAAQAFADFERILATASATVAAKARQRSGTVQISATPQYAPPSPAASASYPIAQTGAALDDSHGALNLSHMNMNMKALEAAEQDVAAEAIAIATGGLPVVSASYRYSTDSGAARARDGAALDAVLSTPPPASRSAPSSAGTAAGAGGRRGSVGSQWEWDLKRVLVAPRSGSQSRATAVAVLVQPPGATFAYRSDLHARRIQSEVVHLSCPPSNIPFTVRAAALGLQTDHSNEGGTLARFDAVVTPPTSTVGDAIASDRVGRIVVDGGSACIVFAHAGAGTAANALMLALGGGGAASSASSNGAFGGTYSSASSNGLLAPLAEALFSHATAATQVRVCAVLVAISTQSAGLGYRPAPPQLYDLIGRASAGTGSASAGPAGASSANGLAKFLPLPLSCLKLDPADGRMFPDGAITVRLTSAADLCRVGHVLHTRAAALLGGPAASSASSAPSGMAFHIVMIVDAFQGVGSLTSTGRLCLVICLDDTASGPPGSAASASAQLLDAITTGATAAESDSKPLTSIILTDVLTSDVSHRMITTVTVLPTA
jgi:hypothetical protein